MRHYRNILASLILVTTYAWVVNIWENLGVRVGGCNRLSIRSWLKSRPGRLVSEGLPGRTNMAVTLDIVNSMVAQSNGVNEPNTILSVFTYMLSVRLSTILTLR